MPSRVRHDSRNLTVSFALTMSLNIFVSSSVSRLAKFALPNLSSRFSTNYLRAAFTRSPTRHSIRFISHQFQPFAGVKDSRHADLTRDIIKDAVDQQVQNRPASSTPDQRWQDRSKRALENVARRPPADTYSGSLFCPHVVSSRV